MRFFTLTGLLAAAVLAAAPAAALQDVEKSFDFNGFDKIEVSGVYHLNVDVGDEFSVRLAGPREEMERVEADVKSGTLKLGMRGERWLGGKRRSHDGVEARITVPALQGLHMSGVVDGEVRGIDGDAFDVAISGVGEMRLHGKCLRLNAEVSGVGELDGEGLRCDDVTVVVSGVGEARVYAIDAVDALVSGMGDITVYGSPKKVKKSGGMFADISIR